MMRNLVRFAGTPENSKRITTRWSGSASMSVRWRMVHIMSAGSRSSAVMRSRVWARPQWPRARTISRADSPAGVSQYSWPKPSARGLFSTIPCSSNCRSRSISSARDINGTPRWISLKVWEPNSSSRTTSGVHLVAKISDALATGQAGVNVVHVPYRGNAPALSDLLGGQVEFMFASAPSTIEYIRTGKLRALAVTTTKRSEALADVPAVAEFLPGFEASSWYGMGAPKNTPAEIVEKLNKEVNAALADPKMKARLA